MTKTVAYVIRYSDPASNATIFWIFNNEVMTHNALSKTWQSHDTIRNVKFALKEMLMNK